MNVKHVLLTQLRKAIEEMTPNDEVVIDMGLAMALDQFLERHEDAELKAIGPPEPEPSS